MPCNRFVMKKMNKEFEELMFTKTEGRMIEQLTVINNMDESAKVETKWPTFFATREGERQSGLRD